MMKLCLWFTLMFVSPEPIYVAYGDTITVSAKSCDDLQLLARLVYCEAGNQPMVGKLAVAQVVVNRQKYFSKLGVKTSLRSVILSKGQFDGIKTKYFHQEPTVECYDAAFKVLVMEEKVLPETVLYFANEKIATDKKWLRTVQNLKVITYYDHTFYDSKQALRLYAAL